MICKDFMAVFEYFSKPACYFQLNWLVLKSVDDFKEYTFSTFAARDILKEHSGGGLW